MGLKGEFGKLWGNGGKVPEKSINKDLISDALSGNRYTELRSK